MQGVNGHPPLTVWRHGDLNGQITITVATVSKTWFILRIILLVLEHKPRSVNSIPSFNWRYTFFTQSVGDKDKWSLWRRRRTKCIFFSSHSFWCCCRLAPVWVYLIEGKTKKPSNSNSPHPCIFIHARFITFDLERPNYHQLCGACHLN